MVSLRATCENRVIENTTPDPPATNNGARNKTTRSHRSQHLRRSRDNRYVGGVCGGIGERIGVDPTVLRIIAVPLTILAGSGFVAYIAAWILLARDDERSIAEVEVSDRTEMRNVVAVVTIALGLLLALQALGLRALGTLAWPLLLGSVGLFIVWRGASEDERTFLRNQLERVPIIGSAKLTSRRAKILRIALGVILIIFGLGGVAATARPGQEASRGFLGGVVVIGGFLVIFGPWWLKLLRELTEERRNRVRAEERSNMAAHIHDSVLQTLMLIQKSADDPAKVTRLVRSQERELRSWLFEGKTPGQFLGDPTTVAMAVASIEGEVEDHHGVGVETVVVGDCPLDESLRALLGAGREATVNAAKWSGADNVSIFVEIDSQNVSMFVRDRGRGFDPTEVPADRSGISQSIYDRMNRNGGKATIRSQTGFGTEVELLMPRPDVPQ